MTEFYGFNTEALTAAVDYRRAALVRSGRRSSLRSHWWHRLPGSGR